MRNRVTCKMRSCVIFLLAVGLGSSQAATVEHVQVLMGTTARVRVWGDRPAACEQAIEAAFEEMADVDRLMSTYRPESQICRLNRNGASGWVEIDPRLYEVLEAAGEYGELSNGAFDPTVFPLVRLWGFRGGTPAIPDSGVLAEYLARVGHRHIRLHLDGRHARFDRSGVEVDLGGIAKGYALDRAVSRLKHEGMAAALVDLGGNLSVFGTGPGALVAVQDPLTPEGLLGTISLGDASAATSGGYERYVTIQGKRYGHILDPRTGVPAGQMLSVTAVSPSGMAADALSTALFILGPVEGVQLLEEVDGAEGILVWESEDGGVETYVSNGLRPDFTPVGSKIKAEQQAGF